VIATLGARALELPVVAPFEPVVLPLGALVVTLAGVWLGVMMMYAALRIVLLIALPAAVRKLRSLREAQHG
jgi:hypothetical protein